MSTTTPGAPAPSSAGGRQTASKDRIPFSEKLSYAAGLVGFSFGYSGVSSLAYPIYNITLGLSPTLIGIVLAVSRLWDAITDPVMGSISDNSKNPKGRRIPFIMLGAILCALCFPLMWIVPTGISSTAAFWYFMMTALLFFTAFTVFSVPYLSLSYELTPDTRERTRLSGVCAMVGKLTGLSLPWVYRVAQADFFPDTATGMRWLGVGIGLCFVIFALPMVFKCRERLRATAAKQGKISLKDGLRETFKNRPFVFLVLIVMLMQCGTTMVGSLGIYVNSYYIFGGDTKMGASYHAMGNTIYVILSMAAIPLITWAAGRYGKRTVMFWCLASGFAACVSKYFCFIPEYPKLQFVSMALMAPAFTAFWVMVGPMKADTADYDESLTGMRREGTYAAVANWIEKVGLTGALLLSGAILDFAGFKLELSGDQTPETFFTIRVLFAFVPAVALLIGIFLLRFYPLTEQRMDRLRDEMEARRGVA